VMRLLGLGWAGFPRYVRDSQIGARALARLRARFASCFPSVRSRAE
jgi:hypothetical protein